MEREVRVVWVNGVRRELVGASTVADLVQEMGASSGPVAVERNGELVPRAQHGRVVLEDGDRVAVVTLVGGG